LTVACASFALALAAASCATAIGLDQVSRVDCVEDCGADGSSDVSTEALVGDSTLGDVKTTDGPIGDRESAEASRPECTPGQACDGGRCDDAGVCRPGCTSNAGCTAPNPVCDTTTTVCVPCLPQSDTCPLGTICVPQGSEYTCAMGCNTVADCAGSDAGAPANACCNHVCSNTTTDNGNCGACGMVCAGGASAACAQGKCVYTIGGTLAGLPATESIVLQNNSSDDLTLHANGAFSFSTPIATGSMYDVTILTTPLGQTCGVTSPSGVVAGADVTNVQVSCMSCYVAGSATFSYTGAVQSWTVPCGVTSASFTVDGAAGAANSDGNVAGGLGGSATGTLTVTQGQVLEVFVGGAATTTTGGWNGGGAGGTGASSCSGGGGGGASDVRATPYALGNRVIVAGGGGGGGGDRVDAVGAGAGGGGGGGYYGGGGGESWGGAGGGAGTQATGGAAGCGSGCSGASTCGSAGSLGSGGPGGAAAASDQAGTQNGGAGGGGGGATGVAGATGGPCGTNYSGGAGGGGSGYVGGVTGGATSSAVHAGNGQVTITW
jgi:hypothetical protein